MNTPDWLQGVQAATSRGPLRERLPLSAAGAVIGSAEESVLRQLAAHGVASGHSLLHETPAGWQVPGEPISGLQAIAQALHLLGLAGPWRDEQLAVCDPQGVRVATIERAAVRPLGIPTQAVHLVGFAPDGRVWVQQRAFDKSNDPGLWDTLMGGMVSAGDTLQTALARETMEEAGLSLDVLRGLRAGGRVHLRRPSSEGAGTGYLVEVIDWYRAEVPFGLAPVNLDGEVEQFELLTRSELLQRLEGGAFTLEAALILAAALG